LRVRARVKGSSARPRLNIYRSNLHIYAQVIDDDRLTTLVSASTLDPQVRTVLQQGHMPKVQQAALVGTLVAQRALERGIQAVVFDRGGYRYHGRVKALAEAARAAGLKF
jgi:large subunit ribosomal protein L18